LNRAYTNHIYKVKKNPTTTATSAAPEATSLPASEVGSAVSVVVDLDVVVVFEPDDLSVLEPEASESESVSVELLDPEVTTLVFVVVTLVPDLESELDSVGLSVVMVVVLLVSDSVPAATGSGTFSY